MAKKRIRILKAVRLFKKGVYEVGDGENQVSQADADRWTECGYARWADGPEAKPDAAKANAPA